MKVPELIVAFDEQKKTLTDLSIPFAERFKLLVDSAYQYRYNSTVQKLIKAAKLRYPLADIASVHYTEGRELKREVINELATCNFIAQHKAVVLKGPSGSGKTWIACTHSPNRRVSWNTTRFTFAHQICSTNTKSRE